MPSGLQIAGVDFWDRLLSDILWSERIIRCTGQDGKTFTMPFSIGGEHTTTVSAIKVMAAEPTRYVKLRNDVHLLPRQRTKVDVTVDNMTPVLDDNDIWALLPTKLTMPDGINRTIKITIPSISHQQPQVVVQNPLRQETMSIPAGSVIAVVTSHATVLDALSDGGLLDTVCHIDHRTCSSHSRGTRDCRSPNTSA